jgi:hypothetical protein
LDFFSLQLNQIEHLQEMVDRGINKFDLTNLNLKHVDLDS